MSPRLIALSLALAALPSLAHAEDVAEVSRQRANSVNVSPLGVLIGAYNVNYERLLSGGHGLLVEGGFTHLSNDEVSATGFGGGLGYRYHFRGEMNGGFAGVNLHAARASADADVVSGGMRRTFDVDVTALSLTANIGRRWVWDSGFNITARIGAGYADYDLSSSSSDPDVQEAIDEVNDFYTRIPVAIDGELSIGWAF